MRWIGMTMADQTFSWVSASSQTPPTLAGASVSMSRMLSAVNSSVRADHSTVRSTHECRGEAIRSVSRPVRLCPLLG